MLQKKSWHKQDETYYNMPLHYASIRSNPIHPITSYLTTP